MALTNKGSKWERKNSLFLITAFIPFLNCISFFHMNSRLKNRKWMLLGWFAIFLQIALTLCSTLVPTIMYSNGPQSPSYSDVAGSYPSVEDYMTKEQKAKFYEDSSYADSTEFKLSSEYENYKKDYDEYYQNMIAWEKTPEIAAKISEYENYNAMRRGITVAIRIVWVIQYVIFILFAFNERPKYLRLLAQSENKTDFTERMSARQNTPQPFAYNQTQSSVQNTATVKIDINSAIEEDFTSLTGITIIDAKKAIAYREEHGGFRTVDEFFTCINAKPHIIASIEKQLTVGAFETEKKDAVGNNGKRQLDL